MLVPREYVDAAHVLDATCNAHAWHVRKPYDRWKRRTVDSSLHRARAFPPWGMPTPRATELPGIDVY
jgi:hypothetical protein